MAVNLTIDCSSFKKGNVIHFQKTIQLKYPPTAGLKICTETPLGEIVIQLRDLMQNSEGLFYAGWTYGPTGYVPEYSLDEWKKSGWKVKK